jgi:hypothetical protein
MIRLWGASMGYGRQNGVLTQEKMSQWIGGNGKNRVPRLLPRDVIDQCYQEAG